MTFPYSYLIYTILFLIVDVMGAFLWLLSASPLRLDPIVAWQTFIFVVILMGGIGFAVKYIPQTSLDGEEMVIAYRKAKKAAAKAETPGRSH